MAGTCIFRYKVVQFMLLDFKRTLIPETYYYKFMSTQMEVEMTQPLKRKATLVLGPKQKKWKRRSLAVVGSKIAAPRQRVQLAYGFSGLVPNAAATGDQVFNLNSLFDPDRTGVGAQPNGFDQWAALYNRYVVYKAKVEAIFNCNTANVTLACMIKPANSDAAQTVPVGIGTQMSHFGTAHSGGMPWRAVKTFQLWKINGRTFKEYMADDLNQATIGASPASIIVLRCRAEDMAGAAVTGALLCRITYFAEFFDTIQLGQS